MKWLLVVFAILCLGASGAQDRKKKKEKPPDVQIMELKIKRVEAEVTLDGRVRATGEKPVENLILVFEFLKSNKAVASSRRVTTDDPVLEPGDDTVFHAATTYPMDATECRVRAYLSGDRELSVANPGPFPIEQ